MISFIIGMMIGLVLRQFRWGLPIFYGASTIVLSYAGSMWLFLGVFLFVDALASAWTGDPFVVWRATFPPTTHDWTRELELASALDTLDVIRSRPR